MANSPQDGPRQQQQRVGRLGAGRPRPLEQTTASCLDGVAIRTSPADGRMPSQTCTVPGPCPGRPAWRCRPGRTPLEHLRQPTRPAIATKTATPWPDATSAPEMATAARRTSVSIASLPLCRVPSALRPRVGIAPFSLVTWHSTLLTPSRRRSPTVTRRPWCGGWGAAALQPARPHGPAWASGLPRRDQQHPPAAPPRAGRRGSAAPPWWPAVRPGVRHHGAPASRSPIGPGGGDVAAACVEDPPAISQRGETRSALRPDPRGERLPQCQPVPQQSAAEQDEVDRRKA